ncbi:MAG: hypothetical protein RLZZ192_463 [Pseudomonadota bacterium]
MSGPSSNPFVLPGLGQTGDMANNPLFASMEMMRKAFAGLAGPAGLGAGVGLAPPMNPEELERKIAELKSVENWLKLNLSMLSSTIQGMEVQLATIATLKSFVAAATPATQEPAATNSSEVPAAAQAWWNMLTQQFSQVAAATAASMGSANEQGATDKKATTKKATKRTVRKTSN